MTQSERVVTTLSAFAFSVAAILIANYLPNERSVDPVLIAGLVAGYAVASQVRFEFGRVYMTPEQLTIVPMLLLLPLPLIPALVIVGGLLAALPDILEGSRHRDRWIVSLADSWFCIGPVIVIAALAPGEPTLAHLEVYGLAFAIQIAIDFAWGAIRDVWFAPLLGADSGSLSGILHTYKSVLKFDSMLTPPAWAITFVAVEEPIALLMLAPLVLMLDAFAKEREVRYQKAMELQRAYRGTVTLLSDVVEFEDSYTAEHSRGVMDLVLAVAEEMQVAPEEHERLEFAAMLHDVGKISIPKEILNKPASLTPAEFAVIKQHTLKGQDMLIRVGGLLDHVGEIVRSCHERWDGTGYPDRLKGERIPLAARIVFYCDAYNAMTTDRVYRRAMSLTAALAELEAHAGTQFDPRVAEAGARVLRRLEAVEGRAKPSAEGAEKEKAALPRRVGVPA